MWVLIGEGPNDVEIPCLVWSDGEKALVACNELFKTKPKVYKEENGSVRYRWHDADGEFSEEILNKMYKDYYGGCGECYAATLLEVKEGKPFASWNLD